LGKPANEFSHEQAAASRINHRIIRELRTQHITSIARYMSSHHRWSVYFEQHELGAAPPTWLDSSHWDGILCRPTDPVLARRPETNEGAGGGLERSLRRFEISLGRLEPQGNRLPWSNHLWNVVFIILPFAGLAMSFGPGNDAMVSVRSLKRRTCPCRFMNHPGVAQLFPDGNLEIEHIGKWLRDLPKPIGIMACNDARALHLLDACHQTGMLVPEEVAVIGVDNEEIFCELCNPALSSVAPDAERIGYLAAELLDKLMSGQSPPCQRILVDPVRVATRAHRIHSPSKSGRWQAAVRFISDQALHGCTVADVINMFGSHAVF